MLPKIEVQKRNYKYTETKLKAYNGFLKLNTKSSFITTT